MNPVMVWLLFGISASLLCSFRCWGLQLPGQNMELIVFSNAYGKPDFGNFSKSKYEVKHSVPENGVFTVNMLEPKDSDKHDQNCIQHCCRAGRSVFKFPNRSDPIFSSRAAR
ncbi:hypothetical protein GN956_G5628 [Arapaima gigas]